MNSCPRPLAAKSCADAASATSNGPNTSPNSFTTSKRSICALVPMVRVHKPKPVTSTVSRSRTVMKAASPSPRDDHSLRASPSIAFAAAKAPPNSLLAAITVAPASAVATSTPRDGPASATGGAEAQHLAGVEAAVRRAALEAVGVLRVGLEAAQEHPVVAVGAAAHVGVERQLAEALVGAEDHHAREVDLGGDDQRRGGGRDLAHRDRTVDDVVDGERREWLGGGGREEQRCEEGEREASEAGHAASMTWAFVTERRAVDGTPTHRPAGWWNERRAPDHRPAERQEPMKAIWNDHVIAESDATIVVEGNHYFPLDAVDPAVLRPSTTTSACPWKGAASYYSLEVAGEVNRDAAFTYREPKPAAAEIKDHVAFWRGVEVVGS